MALFKNWFLSQETTTNIKLRNLFPLGIIQPDFIREDVINTFKKILTDTIERSHKIPDKYATAIYDNFLQSEAEKGLISFLAQAMHDQGDLFLVYKEEILRLATREEQTQIKEDYEKKGKSSIGIYISFKDYNLSKLLKIYAGFEYSVLGSLNKILNLSNAIQLKMDGLRDSVGLNDSSIASEQGKEIADGLANGEDVLIDAKDIIETATIQTEQVDSALALINNKRAYLLGLPVAYITGELTAGIGSTGEADTKAIERGLKVFFASIIKPVFKEIFGLDLEFKSQDFRNIETALEVLRTFDLVSEDVLSNESKREIIARVFDLELSEEKKRIEKEKKEHENLFKDHENDDQESHKPFKDKGRFF